jgi:hypothetical protein
MDAFIKFGWESVPAILNGRQIQLRRRENKLKRVGFLKIEKGGNY